MDLLKEMRRVPYSHLSLTCCFLHPGQERQIDRSVDGCGGGDFSFYEILRTDSDATQSETRWFPSIDSTTYGFPSAIILSPFTALLCLCSRFFRGFGFASLRSLTGCSLDGCSSMECRPRAQCGTSSFPFFFSTSSSLYCSKIPQQQTGYPYFFRMNGWRLQYAFYLIRSKNQDRKLPKFF